MSDFRPDPTKYTMRGNAPAARSEPQPVVIIPNLSDDALKQMAREKLSALLQGIDANRHPSLLLSVAREIMDRIEGKPTQRIEQRIESVKGPASEMSTEQLMLLVGQLKQLPDGVRLLPTGVLEIDNATYSEIEPD